MRTETSLAFWLEASLNNSLVEMDCMYCLPKHRPASNTQAISYLIDIFRAHMCDRCLFWSLFGGSARRRSYSIISVIR
jgi:hypothetical protein